MPLNALEPWPQELLTELLTRRGAQRGGTAGRHQTVRLLRSSNRPCAMPGA